MKINLRKAEFLFVLLIPLLNTLVNIFVSPEASGVHFGIFRAIILFLFCIYFLLKRFRISLISIFVILYLTYFLILLPFSDDLYSSAYLYVQVFTITLLFVIGYQYLDNVEKLRKFQKYVFYTFVFLSGYIIVAIIFQIGTPAYRGEAFYTGNAGVNVTKNMIFAIFAMPILFQQADISTRSKFIYILGAVIFLVLIFLGLKRSAVLGVIFGGVVLFILYPKYKTSYRYISAIILILVLSSPLYLDRFYSALDSRETAMEQVADAPITIQEGDSRFGELYYVAELVSYDMKSLFFGMLDPFRTVGVYPPGSSRVLHVDYSVYLYSGGIIGLLFFIGLYIVAIVQKNRVSKEVKKIKEYRELNAILYAMIMGALILSIAGGWSNYGLRGLLMLYMGGIISSMNNSSE